MTFDRAIHAAEALPRASKTPSLVSCKRSVLGGSSVVMARLRMKTGSSDAKGRKLERTCATGKPRCFRHGCPDHQTFNALMDIAEARL